MKFRLYSPVVQIGKKEQGSIQMIVESEDFASLALCGQVQGGFQTPRGHWIPWPCAFVEVVK